MENLTISEDIKNSSSADLIDYIALKTDFPKEAKEAFEVFCLRFQSDVLQKAEIVCSKWDYNEVVALDIASCTFERVWKYPTFNLAKAKASNQDQAIRFWLFKIVQTQLANFHNNDTCHEPTEEEDLSVINTTDELIDYTCSGNVEAKKDLRKKMEFVDKGLSLLGKKHKIIYLTYRAYEKPRKRVPRPVLEKLRTQLGLTQSSVKVYKNEAYEIMDKYIRKYGKN